MYHDGTVASLLRSCTTALRPGVPAKRRSSATRKLMRPKASDGTPLRSGISVGPSDAFNVSLKYPSTPTPVKGGTHKVENGKFKNQYGQTVSEKQYRKGVAGDRVSAGTEAFMKSLNRKKK